MEKLLPIAMIVMSVLASAAYLYNGNYPKAIYWIAASFLTGSTLYMQ